MNKILERFIIARARYIAYDKKYISKTYRFREKGNGRRFALGDLTAPGGPNKGNPKYEFMGVTRYWRYSKERIKDLLENDRIVQRSPGSVPLLKRYLDEMMGKPAQDVWDDLRLVRGKEKCGYPTQKPQKLLERLIYASTDPGDLVIDPVCGSGSTLVAADRLGRKWLGIDISKQSCSLSVKRLRGLGIETNLVDFGHKLRVSQTA